MCGIRTVESPLREIGRCRIKHLPYGTHTQLCQPAALLSQCLDQDVQVLMPCDLGFEPRQALRSPL
jgi:hypothetical protein